MKEIIIYVVIMIAIFLFMAKTTVTFEPFSIKFERLWTAIGFVLVILGIAFIQLQGEIDKEKIMKDKEIFFDFERDKSN